MPPLLPFLGFFSLLCIATAEVTVYGQTPIAFATTGTGGPTATRVSSPAYDETRLQPPPLPSPPPPTAFTLDLPASGGNVNGLSIPQSGSFYGFSIEMSVINQVLGKNSTHINVPFLNLLSNIQARAGFLEIRMGGNTQEFAFHVDTLDNHAAVGKEKSDLKNPTLTPAVLYTTDLFYIMANVSSFVNVRWYLGIPFNDTTNWRLQIAELGQQILGDKLIGLQAGNEPDLYADHKHRPETYSEFDYFGEFGSLVQTIASNDRIPRKNMLIGPSLANAAWTLERVWNTGFIDAYKDNLYALTIENYPNNNCFAQFGLGSAKDPQTEFPSYLNHDAGRRLVAPFLNSSAIAQAVGKPFIMFETNTASCGGFPGISDSFGAALWALDYGLTMAASNFSGAMLHVGGQNVYYNPFTAPPTNMSSFSQWTVGAVYYSALIVAEVFGATNTSRIADVSNNGIFTPAYSIYENGALARVALFNFNDDPSGGSDITATITVNGGSVPSQVRVKYFAAESVSVKTNLTWAGQTLGNKFQVDGRLKGDLNVVTVSCDQSNNRCLVPVKAPGFALVFLTDSPSITGESQSFTTSAQTQTVNTVTVDPAVLATSNGISGKDRVKLGSTSKGSSSGAVSSRIGASVLLAVLGGAIFVVTGVGR